MALSGGVGVVRRLESGFASEQGRSARVEGSGDPIVSDDRIAQHAGRVELPDQVGVDGPPRLGNAPRVLDRDERDVSIDELGACLRVRVRRVDRLAERRVFRVAVESRQVLLGQDVEGRAASAGGPVRLAWRRPVARVCLGHGQRAASDHAVWRPLPAGSQWCALISLPISLSLTVIFSFFNL